MLFSLVGIPLHLSCNKLKQNKKQCRKEAFVALTGGKIIKIKKPMPFTMNYHLPGSKMLSPF
jgi:hypothetical protein